MQVVISAPLEMFDVARYGWVAMIQHSELRRLPLSASHFVIYVGEYAHRNHGLTHDRQHEPEN